MPDVCPRIYLRITDTDLADDTRVAGEGSINQVRDDLAALAELGCTSVMLDNYTDDGLAAADPQIAWDMLQIIAEEIFDLPAERIR